MSDDFNNNEFNQNSQNNKNEHKQIIIGVVIIIALIAFIAVLSQCSKGSGEVEETDTDLYTETTTEDYYSNYDTDYDDYDDDSDYEEETNYVRTNTKYLYNNLESYCYEPITTTIKINYKFDNYYCGYSVENTKKYDEFLVAFDFEDSEYNCAKYKKGDYITVSGYADGISYDEGAIVIEVDKIEPTDKSLFNKISKKPISNPTSTNGFSANGTGDYVAKGLKVKNCAILNVTSSDGCGHFSVTSYKDGEYEDLLVNTVDKYTGTVLVEGSGTYDLEINCSGSWTITSSGLTINDKTSFSGTGDSVTGLTSHCGGSWKITHTGSHNFAVIEHGINYGYLDLLVNEIGNYSGIVMAPEKDDAVFFEVKADGSWTIKKE